MRRCFWLPPAICLLVVARPDQCVAVSNAAFCAPATVLSKSAPRTLHCRSPLSASVAPRDDVVHAATEAWLKEWVIDLRLCPWARLTRGKTPAGAPYSKVLVLRGGEERIDELAAAVWAEAAALQDRERARINIEASASPHDESRFFTTLLIFPDSAFGGQGPANCGAFPKLVRTAQALLHHDRGTESADGECALGVDLLAFHRWRLDEGPGTTTCPDDAAHFSVRCAQCPYTQGLCVGQHFTTYWHASMLAACCKRVSARLHDNENSHALT